jgi:hypothetical protein
MAGREQPSGRIRRTGPERFLGRQRHGGAPRGGVPVARDGTRLASVASRLTSATVKGSTLPGAPPAPSFRGRVIKRTQRECKRKARTRTRDCSAGTKKRRLFDIVNGNDARGRLGRGACAIASAATHSGHGRGRAFPRPQGNVPARMRKRRDTAVTTDRRRRRCCASSTRARGQPTAVQVPSGLRQALPRATCGLPSI